jgi:cell fate regulator YaaT (PSP1 superfamily)
MPHLIEVAFGGNRKEFFLWDHDELPAIKAGVIVDADRGEDLGRVHATGAFAEKRYAGVPHGAAAGPVAKQALRLASVEDMRRASEVAAGNADARRRAMERVRAYNLVMKLSDAEWQWDRKKVTFYFTAEKRVDFRQLVRDLAAMFRARIELKQIGVRDEAKRLDGIGRCGRQYCSAVWLPELRPVNLGVAKDQRLSLNPSQISGACGRLMCSLRYEHDFYVQSRKRFPKEGKILATSLGEEKVVATDIFRDRVTLRTVEGETRVVELADLKRELAEVADVANGRVDADEGGAAGPAADAFDGAAEGRSDAERGEASGTPVTVAAALDAAAIGDGEIPVSLPADRDAARPSRPLREPERRATPPFVPAASAAGEADAGESDEDEGEGEGADDATTTAAPGEERRPRRRRGRRGGRRGRGPGSSPAGDAAGSSDGE